MAQLNSRVSTLMRAIAAALFIAAVCGCSGMDTHPATDASMSCYQSTDGTRYNNLYLRLNTDRTYTAEIQGDITKWGTASGTWSALKWLITLSPDTEAGMMKGFLKTVYKKSNSSLSFSTGPSSFSSDWTDLEPFPCGP